MRIIRMNSLSYEINSKFVEEEILKYTKFEE